MCVIEGDWKEGGEIPVIPQTSMPDHAASHPPSPPGWKQLKQVADDEKRRMGEEFRINFTSIKNIGPKSLFILDFFGLFQCFFFYYYYSRSHSLSCQSQF